MGCTVEPIFVLLRFAVVKLVSCGGSLFISIFFTAEPIELFDMAGLLITFTVAAVGKLELSV